MPEPETSKGPKPETEARPEAPKPGATDGGSETTDRGSETPNGGSGPSRTPLLIGGGVVAVVALVVVLIVALGGGDDGSDGDDGGLPPNVITDEDIQAQDEGTPERALLEWWQAFQFQDTAGVVLLTSPNTLDDVGENDLEDLVQARGQGLQGIEILGSTESGDDASVRAGLLTFQPPEQGAPPPDEPTASTPTTFALVKEDNEWLFDDDAYLEPQIENLRASEEAAEEQQSEDGSQDESSSDESGG